MNIDGVRQAWQKLADRADLIGKEVIFENRIGDCVDRGTISRIRIDGDHVVIESPEIAAAHIAGNAWAPNIRFKIEEDRTPDLIGDTIFCDLDDNYRQIQIRTI